MGPQEKLRTFVALPLSEAGHERLDAVQQKLIRALPDGAIRWVPPTNVHLTLFFLGDVAVGRLPVIREALAVVARNVAPFPFEVRGLGAFPHLRRPRVLWVGVAERAGRLALLHRAVNEVLAQVGFEPETRPFHPHLTLGRVRRGNSRAVEVQLAEELSAIEVGLLIEEQARELVLFRSVLGSAGAEYTALHRFPLAP